MAGLLATPLIISFFSENCKTIRGVYSTFAQITYARIDADIQLILGPSHSNTDSSEISLRQESPPA